MMASSHYDFRSMIEMQEVNTKGLETLQPNAHVPISFIFSKNWVWFFYIELKANHGIILTVISICFNINFWILIPCPPIIRMLFLETIPLTQKYWLMVGIQYGLKIKGRCYTQKCRSGQSNLVGRSADSSGWIRCLWDTSWGSYTLFSLILVPPWPSKVKPGSEMSE